MLPNSRFTDLLADIEPSATTKSHAQSAHTKVRDHLRTHPDFKKRRTGDFLAGSYSRDTAIRPRKTADGHDRPDVDIIIETSFSTNDAPDDVLNELARALKDAFTVERINKRSVRVVTTNSEIDVVPVRPLADVYQLPDRDLGGWKLDEPARAQHVEYGAEQRFLRSLQAPRQALQVVAPPTIGRASGQGFRPGSARCTSRAER